MLPYVLVVVNAFSDIRSIASSSGDEDMEQNETRKYCPLTWPMVRIFVTSRTSGELHRSSSTLDGRGPTQLFEEADRKMSSTVPCEHVKLRLL